jgi:hypothetical protein
MTIAVVEMKSGTPMIQTATVQKLPPSMWLDCDARRLKSM